MYKCIKNFMLEVCDDEGSTIDGKYEEISKDSLWNISKGCIFNDIKLTQIGEKDYFRWIEISKGELKEYFIKAQGE